MDARCMQIVPSEYVGWRRCAAKSTQFIDLDNGSASSKDGNGADHYCQAHAENPISREQVAEYRARR